MPQQKLTLSKQAQRIHQEMVSRISNQIEAQGGELAFDKFMQIALYEPGLGYYQNNLFKIGEKGDFVTAPEMGNLFAFGLKNALISIESELTRNILELGAGSGALVVSLLKLLSSEERMPEKYFILEPSASLQAMQKDRIEQEVPEFINRVEWLNRLPDDFNGVIIGNEVIDAIPFKRIKKKENGWQQQFIELKNQKITHDLESPFQTKDSGVIDNDELPEVLSEATDIAVNYQTEIRPMVKPWIKSLAKSLTKGILLLIDYGYPELEYYHSQRREGTLRCFSRHISHSEPLELVGLQDITAHVDFTDLARCAIASGLNVEGFTTQAGFLLENGILEAAQNGDEKQQLILSQQIQKLTAPGQMGEVMKVIAFSKAAQTEISGFKLQDQLHRL